MTGMMGTCFTTMTGRLSDEEKDAFVEMAGGTDVVRQALRGERTIKLALKNGTPGAILGGLLEETDDMIELPAVPLFVTREKFVENRNGEVPIAYICGYAQDFLDIVEENIPAIVLKRYKALRRATDVSTLSALGDKNLVIERARSRAAHLYSFLRDKASVFECYTGFVLGASGNPLSLHLWYDDGWHIEILPVPYPRELEIGDYVVSPSSAVHISHFPTRGGEYA